MAQVMAWCRQDIDFPWVRFCGIHLRATAQATILYKGFEIIQLLPIYRGELIKGALALN